MRKNPKINLVGTFSNAIEVKKNDKLQDRIQELETKLQKGKGEIISVKIDEIFPNKNQPRKSFYVVDELAESLEKHRLKQPIILIEVDNKKIIFDGECRWRAAKKIGWTEIDSIIVPYDKNTFDDDVLISSTHRNNLNSLDLAEAIVKKIKQKLPKLTAEDIARKLDTLIRRIKRQKKTSELLREEWEDLELAEDEITIAETILFYGWNPISINTNKFPLLKIPSDLKKAIRNKGLKDHSATAIAKINHLKINEIDEQKAVSLRKKITNEAIKNNWTTTQVKAEVRKVIEEINPSESVGENQKILNNCYKAVRAVPLDKLSKEERKELLSEILKLANQLQLE